MVILSQISINIKEKYLPLMNLSFSTAGMPTFKTKRQKFGIGSFIILVIMGAGFTIAGYAAYKSMQIDPSWPRTQGTVVGSSSRISDGSELHTPIVEYTVNGQTYQVPGGSSSSARPTIGSAKEVGYNPANPDEAKAVQGLGVMSLVLLFPVVGTGMLIIAPVLLIKSLRRSSRIKKLLQTGHKVQGVIVDLASTRSNGSNYKIVVAATDNYGTVQNYESDGLQGIAGLAMSNFQNNPIVIDVYLDPADPKNYYVDISDIPSLSPQRISELVQSAVTRQQTAAAPTSTPGQLPNQAPVPPQAATQSTQPPTNFPQ